MRLDLKRMDFAQVEALIVTACQLTAEASGGTDNSFMTPAP
jgi:hypothetical protein